MRNNSLIRATRRRSAGDNVGMFGGMFGGMWGGMWPLRGTGILRPLHHLDAMRPAAHLEEPVRSIVVAAGRDGVGRRP